MNHPFNQPVRLPGLTLRLRSGQAPGVGSGLILSGVFSLDLKNRVCRCRMYQDDLTYKNYREKSRYLSYVSYVFLD